MVEYSVGYGIEFEAIQQWATQCCGFHNEDTVIVYFMFFESSKAEGGRGHHNQLPTTWRMDGRH